MNTAIATRGFTLRQWLIVDALTCVATGLVLVVAASPLDTLLGLPTGLLNYAGIVLFPCGALMLWASRTLSPPLVWIVIAGNFAWAVASLAVAFALSPTGIGLAVILAQAAAVAALGWLELRAR